jgi:hypothetical protein
MQLNLDGATVCAGVRDGIATFEFSGAIERATVVTALSLFRAQHRGERPIGSKLRFDRAKFVKGFDWRLDSIDQNSKTDLPSVIVVPPRAVEWAVAYAHARAMEGLVIGVFTDPELARRWVRARAAVHLVLP